ncbi:MAG TPA: hypothetical protein VGO78_15670 [Acidimicrobiales bacterium]|nr:hypothetical protein [Acidimicrobiales bacterium]
MLRLAVGLVLCGGGIALMVRADLGLAPWSVLDQGLAERTGLQIGTVSIITGAIVLTMWIPLRQRPGIGTIANIVLIGLTIDAVLAVVDPPGSTAGRVAFMLLGVAMWGPGSGFYIGAGLGPGPRDGLMTGLHAKGVGSIRVVRTALEVIVLTVGWLLGGSVGVGTVVFALTIGPNVQHFLRLLGVAPRATADAVEAGTVEVGEPAAGARDRRGGNTF